MSRYVDRLRTLVVVGGAVLCLASLAAAQSAEDLARRRLDSGRAFLKAQNYAEALRDFEAVLQTYPTSSVADDALLEIATYQLTVARDPATALTRAMELEKTYAGSDSAPMGLVLQGRISLYVGRSAENINTALASFDRVPRLYPGSDAIPAAMYFGGEAARLAGRRDDALQRFSQVAMQFPTSPWTANALLGSAVVLTRSGNAVRAMEQLQRVRAQFPGTPEAETAKDWNTVLYRLYLRAPAQPSFVFSGRTIGGAGGKLRDVADIAVDAGDNLLVATNNGVTAYGAKGNQAYFLPAVEPHAMSFDRLGKVLTVHELGVRLEGKTPVPLISPVVEGRVRELKPGNVVVTASGDLLLADRDLKAILRFQPTGMYAGEFARGLNVRSLAIDDLDNVFALDRDEKTVSVIDRDGKVTRSIRDRGTGYQMREPSDVRVDRLGHIYVLDKTSVLVFAPDGGRLLTTFTVADTKSPSAIGEGTALALDAAGRLYVFDGRSDLVKVYR